MRITLRFPVKKNIEFEEERDFRKELNKPLKETIPIPGVIQKPRRRKR